MDTVLVVGYSTSFGCFCYLPSFTHQCITAFQYSDCWSLSFTASLAGADSPLEYREKIYLLAVGYYRSGNYSRSRQLVDCCLEVWIHWISSWNYNSPILFTKREYPLIVYPYPIELPHCAYIYVCAHIKLLLIHLVKTIPYNLVGISFRVHPTGDRLWASRMPLKIESRKVSQTSVFLIINFCIQIYTAFFIELICSTLVYIWPRWSNWYWHRGNCCGARGWWYCWYCSCSPEEVIAELCETKYKLRTLCDSL